MSFCPECREEFRADVKTCSTCEVKLVDRLEPVGNGGVDLEVVCTFLDEETAYIVHGSLESEGVPCQLENLSFHAVPSPGAGLTRVRLWVRKDDVELAREIIASHEQLNHCSACGHVASGGDQVCDFCGEGFDAD